MKTEQNHAAQLHHFKSVKEVEANAKTRMEKVIADLQHEMATSAPACLPQPPGQRPGRLLRHADAAESGRHAARARAVHDHHPALGRFADRLRSRRRSAPRTSA